MSGSCALMRYYCDQNRREQEAWQRSRRQQAYLTTTVRRNVVTWPFAKAKSEMRNAKWMAPVFVPRSEHALFWSHCSYLYVLSSFKSQ